MASKGNGKGVNSKKTFTKVASACKFLIDFLKSPNDSHAKNKI